MECALPHIVRAGAVLLCVGVLVSGCGRGADDASTAAGSSADAAAVDPAEPDARSDDAAVVAPRVANAIGRRLDALLAAYAPVSARINFLVTAETLREAAVSSRAGTSVELERAGSVRVEIGRMRTVLAAGRSKVLAVQVSSATQQRLKRQLVSVIDSRQRALNQLELALDGVAAQLGDRAIDARFDRWQAAWDSSLRTAREATNLVQDERARIGLEPSPEGSIR